MKPIRSAPSSSAVQSPHTRAYAASSDVPEAPPASEPALERISRGWTRFWFTPVDAIGLHLIRLLVGLLLVAWLLPFAGYLEEFFTTRGWLDKQAFEQASWLTNGEFAPNASILDLLGSNATSLTATYWASLAILLAFALGFLPRITAILAAVIVASFTANPAFEYEGDALLLTLIFYLTVAYILFGQRTPGISWTSRLFGPLLVWPLGRRKRDPHGEPRPSLAANVTLRLLQVHFALIIFTSGLHKLQFGDWWAGVALWFPLHPPFKTTIAEAMANRPNWEAYLGLLNIATYAILAWQIGFPLFAWRPRWRFVVIGGAAIGWIGAAFLWGLPLIGPAILIGCLSYVSPTTWRWILNRLPSKSNAAVAAIRNSEKSASLVSAGQR